MTSENLVQPSTGRDRRSPTRVRAVVDAISALIDSGALKPGSRIASIRQAALDHGVSKNTMAEAYDRLVARGYVTARPGWGYAVGTLGSHQTPKPHHHVAEALDLVSLLREQLEPHYEVRPGDGRPPSSWLGDTDPAIQLGRSRLLRGGGVDYGYGSSWGYLPLRERLCLSLAERSIRCAPEQVLLTHGANHALDLVIHHLLEPGDVVLVDDPGYYPLFGKLKLARVQVVGVRRLRDGPDLADLDAKARTWRPKVFFTQSLAHNPTGGTLSLATAYGVLQTADRHGFHIVEDDPFADIVPSGSPRLAALDQLSRVIYVGTFSKTLAASLRVGFVAAHRTITQALADLKLLTVVASSHYVERLVFDLIAGGHYLRRTRYLRKRVERAHARALDDLRGLGLEIGAPRESGFYLWAELPDDLDEAKLCIDAAKQGIFMAPGKIFSPTRDATSPATRINIAYASNPRFLDFLRQALSVHPGSQ